MTETTNGHAAPPGWLSTLQAVELSGFRRRKLEKLAREGVLVREKNARGLVFWDAEQLQQAIELDEPSDEPAAPTGAAESTALLKQAHGHLEAALKLVLDPAAALLKQALAENERLRDHVRKLEAAHLDSLAARENLLSEQHLRALATAEVAQSAQRKDRALAMVGQALPKLLASVNPKATAVVALMASLTSEQRGMLLETELLTDEQKGHVRAALEGSTAPELTPTPTNERPDE